MPVLTITDDEGKETLRLTIKRIDPSAATIAILDALRDIPEPKKPRSDRGRKRQPVLALGEPKPE